MRSLTALAVAALLLSPSGRARADAPKPAAAPAPTTLSGPELDRALYAVGLSISRNLEPFALGDAELATVLKGIKEGATGKPAFALDEKAQKLVQDLVQQRLAAAGEREKAKGDEYLRKAGAEKGAVKTGSGLVYLSLKEGGGASPAATDTVKVHYTGTLTDGKVFDSSVQRGQPVDFPLNQVIPCWTEGVGRMKVGGKAKLVCPSAIAYGPGGRPPVIPGNAVLTFEVELLGIEGGAAAPAPVAPGK